MAFYFSKNEFFGDKKDAEVGNGAGDSSIGDSSESSLMRAYSNFCGLKQSSDGSTRDICSEYGSSSGSGLECYNVKMVPSEAVNKGWIENVNREKMKEGISEPNQTNDEGGNNYELGSPCKEETYRSRGGDLERDPLVYDAAFSQTYLEEEERRGLIYQPTASIQGDITSGRKLGDGILNFNNKSHINRGMGMRFQNVPYLIGGPSSQMPGGFLSETPNLEMPEIHASRPFGRTYQEMNYGLLNSELIEANGEDPEIVMRRWDSIKKMIKKRK